MPKGVYDREAARKRKEEREKLEAEGIGVAEANRLAYQRYPADNNGAGPVRVVKPATTPPAKVVAPPHEHDFDDETGICTFKDCRVNVSGVRQKVMPKQCEKCGKSLPDRRYTTCPDGCGRLKAPAESSEYRRFDRLEIAFIDSMSDDGKWQRLDEVDYDDGDLAHHVVGYFLKQTDKSITVCQGHSDEDENPNVMAIMSIPTLAITKVKKL